MAKKLSTVEKHEVIEKNGLHFVPQLDGNFICQELGDIPGNFNKKFKEDPECANALQEMIQKIKYLALNKVRFRKHVNVESMSETEQVARAQEIYAAWLAKREKAFKKKSLFQQFLIWSSGYFMYEVEQYSEIYDVAPAHSIWSDLIDITNDFIPKYVLDVLPKAVQEILKGQMFLNSTCSEKHFALLFGATHDGNRYIVTDRFLLQYPNVGQYVYLSMTKDGYPVARSTTSAEGGGRAFFDGRRLMTHDRFHTCAPKTIVLGSHYKVNSTKCTVIDGKLFDLLEVDDEVAHSTGNNRGWFSEQNWDYKDKLKSHDMYKQTAKLLRFDVQEIFLGEQKLVPIGSFLDSKKTLLDSGFTLFAWSEFQTNPDRLPKILCVDDNKEWIEKVAVAFPKAELMETSNKHEALEQIVKVNPEVLLLDMHLTSDEEFDGLWIANQLAAHNFQGKVFLASSYGQEALKAMQKLIKMPVEIPGKNIEKIRLLLEQTETER